MANTSLKRKDAKGRILYTGEQQRKNGQYLYQYTDNTGKKQYVYSWRLVEGDRTPARRKDAPPLREQERQIQEMLKKGLAYQSGDMTVLELVDKYISLKKGVRETTRTGYKTVRNFLGKDDFGSWKIRDVKLSDAKKFLVDLQQVQKKKYSSIHNIRGVLRPAFRMAVEDDLILKNPFDFELVTVIVNDSVRRDALTPKQERKFLEFVRNDGHFSAYYDTVFILFNTGLRISEYCGLTKKDVDLKEKKVTVRHQLQRGSDMKYHMEEPKTKAGVRELPLTDEVCECFRRILANRKSPKVEPVVDGCGGFLHLDKNGMPMVALHWEKYFEHMVAKYNRTYKEELPKVTPHVCRHTYCSKMAKKGMNPKLLQYLMGHSDISVTMDTYTHVGYEDAREELRRVSDAV